MHTNIDMPPDTDMLPNPMRIILGYLLPTGPRSLVLVHVLDGEHPFSLIDIPSDGPWNPYDEQLVVDDEIDDEGDAYMIAIEHMDRSKQLGRPAVD